MENSKIIIYQMLTRLFGNKAADFRPNGTIEENGVGKFSDITATALQELKKLGCTHVWYTGVIEHATRTDYSAYGIHEDHPAIVKGNAGSPYAIKDYYDICPDLADDVPNRMREFEALVARTHEEGLQVIIDFIPNHLARTYKSDQLPKTVFDFGEKDRTDVEFDPQNNFYYVPHHDLVLPEPLPQIGDAPYAESPAKATGNGPISPFPKIDDWYETIRLNYGIDFSNGWRKHFSPEPRTWLMMRDVLLFWAEKGVDGFRCDMAEIVPVEFWGWVIPQVRHRYPHIIFIAEIYNPSLYHAFIMKGQFDYLYDKVDLYDTVRAVMEGRASASSITHCWQVLEGLDRNMLRFLENHDEQRIASKYFAGDAQMGVPGMTVSACMNRGPVMIYFGQEVGEPAEGAQGFSGDDGRTSIFDYCAVPEHQKWMNDGAFDGKRLSAQQKKLRGFYKRLLQICQKYEAIGKGGFYDVQYLNQGDGLYNAEKIYAFIRHYKNERLLIVANFDKWHGYDLRLKLSDHVFEHIGIREGKPVAGKELLEGKQEFEISLHACEHPGIPMTIGPKQALIFELKQ